MNIRLNAFHILLITGLILCFSSCKKDPEVEPPIMSGMKTSEFFQALPSWEAFADNAPVMDAAPTGAPAMSVSETVDVPQIKDDGSLDTLYNVTYTCQEIPYSLAADPSKIVIYSPDKEILWPGALIQGKSHKNPLGSLNGLVIGERDSINVSIPGLATANNFRRVKPNQAIVASAIGEMIGSATADGLATPSSIQFDMESYRSEKQMALSMGISGKYLGFSGSASGNLSKNQSETTVTVQFFQKMYEVVVEPPQTPSAFFSEEFTPEKLDEQVRLGKMGPDNLPVYVSNVVYGRMMMFSLTSTASEQDIRAMLNVAYNGIGGNVKANMSAKQKTMLEQSKIAITSLGGDAEATISMIQDGNWKAYFTNSAPLSSASPLSYTFRNLGDGSIASIVETDEYTISECTEKVGVPGVFDYLPASTADMSDIYFPVETLTGDFNQDGRDDIMFNHKKGSVNQIKIGYGTADASFDFQPVITNPESPSDSWQNYTTHVADINGDQLPDLIWSYLSTKNHTYYALNQGNNEFNFSQIYTAAQNGWGAYVLHTGDIDNDGADEFVWVYENGSISTYRRIYTGKLEVATGEILYTSSQDINGNFTEYETLIGETNGGGADLIFNRTTSTNWTYVAKSNNDHTFSLSSPSKRSETGWGNYSFFTGHADNNANADLIFNYPGPNVNRVYVNISNGNGMFDVSIPYQDHPVEQDWTSYQMLVGDVDGDGIDDLCWTNQKSGEIVSHLFTALGTQTGVYDFTPVKQSSPYQSTWSQYSTYLLDINGDSKKDMLWIKPGSMTELYIATAK